MRVFVPDNEEPLGAGISIFAVIATRVGTAGILIIIFIEH